MGLGTLGAALSSEPSSALGKPAVPAARGATLAANEGADAVGEWQGIAELKFRIHLPPGESRVRTSRRLFWGEVLLGSSYRRPPVSLKYCGSSARKRLVCAKDHQSGRGLRQGLLPRKHRNRHSRLELRAVLLPLYAHVSRPPIASLTRQLRRADPAGGRLRARLR